MNSSIVETTAMLPAIEHRRSPKRFLDIPVEQEKLHSILMKKHFFSLSELGKR